MDPVHKDGILLVWYHSFLLAHPTMQLALSISELPLKSLCGCWHLDALCCGIWTKVKTRKSSSWHFGMEWNVNLRDKKVELLNCTSLNLFHISPSRCLHRNSLRMNELTGRFLELFKGVIHWKAVCNGKNKSKSFRNMGRAACLWILKYEHIPLVSERA